MRAVVGIGTNIGDREKNITDAIRALNHLPGVKVIKSSAVYETEPWGYLEQQNFYNVCVEIETEFSPNALLGACLGIEAAFGRERPFKNSPRILDLDLLFYENIDMNTSELTLPHPRIGERAFVLVPLKDVLTELNFFGKDYLSAYEKIEKSGIKRLNDIVL